MKNKYKTKKQLIEELEALQKQVDKLKKTETRAKQAGKPSLAAQYWQTMFDAINDAVSIIDRNGKITQCNKAMALLLQKPASEIIGHKCWELVHGSTKPIPECPIVRMKKSLKRETLTLSLMGRWFEVTADPIIDKRGKLAGAVHIIADITERKRAEEELNAERFKLREFFDNLPTLAYNISLDGKIMDCNPMMIKTLGYESKEEVIGKAVVDTIYAPSSRQKASQLFERWKKEGKLKNEEMQIITKKGKILDVLLNVDTIYDMNGNPLYSISTQLDITERKQAEEMLQKSELKYRQLIEQAPDTIFVVDGEGNLLHVNLVGQKMLGYSEDELCKMTTVDTYPLDEMAVARRRLMEMRAMRAGETMHFERLMRRKNGTLSPVEISVGALKDGTTHGIIRDITERKQAEAALRKSEERYRDLYDNAPDMYHTLDENGIIVNCNETEVRVLGYGKEEIVGKPIADFFTEESKRLFESVFPQLKEKKVLLNIEREFIRKDGTTFPAILNIFAEYDEKGKFVGTKTISRDITERKRMEEELKRSNNIKIFGQLAAGVAHEVRNPLNAILAITEALFQDVGDNPEYLPYLEHIRNQVNRLSILMKDLLEIGKPISQDSFQPETVAGIITSTIDLWGTIEMSKGHILRFISQSESEKLHVKTEIARLQQVILNLLQNASQNSPEGSKIVIKVLEPGDKTVNIHIIDRGTGIPHDNLLYVFEPFFTTQKGGTGLGLSIVKHFVESMGGEVAIWNNDPPPGCTVELRLPIATDSES